MLLFFLTDPGDCDVGKGQQGNNVLFSLLTKELNAVSQMENV